MKISIFFLLFFTTFFICNSYGQEKEIKRIGKYIIDKNKSILKEVKMFNRNNKLTEIRNYYDDGDSSKIIYFTTLNMKISKEYKNRIFLKGKNEGFDNNGNILFKIKYNFSKTYEYAFYFYEEDGTLIKKIERVFLNGKSDSVCSSFVDTYKDSEGYYVKKINNILFSKIKKDENNKNVKELFLPKNDSITETIKYKYDIESNLTNRECYKNGKLIVNNVYYYDSVGNITIEELYKNKKFKNRKHFFYNHSGKYYKSTTFSGDIEWITYEAFFGKNEEKFYDYDKEGNILLSEKVYLDKLGNKVKVFYSDIRGRKYFKEMKYNKFNHLIEEIFYKTDKLETIEAHFIYNYTYY